MVLSGTTAERKDLPYDGEVDIASKIYGYKCEESLCMR